MLWCGSDPSANRKMKNIRRIVKNKAIIDEVDKQLINLLQENARRTNVDIAKRIGVSESTVKYRIDRLIKNDIIYFLVLLNPHAIGYPIICSILLRTDPGIVRNIGKKLREINDVVYIGYLAGRFDLICSLYLKDLEHLPELIRNKISTIPGIRSITTLFQIDIKKSSYLWKPFPEVTADYREPGVNDSKGSETKKGQRRRFEENKEIGEIKINNKDKLIIKLLQEDGRQRVKNIARIAKLSELTVKTYLERLFQKRIIKVIAALNPRMFGFRGHFNIGIKVNLSQQESVIEKLIQINEVSYVAHTSGPFDIVIEMMLREPEHLLAIIEKDIGKIPGIQATESFLVLDEETINYSWKI